MATMKALTYAGKETIQLSVVDKPTIQLPTDVIVKITLCGICGRWVTACSALTLLLLLL